jgi:hypothetical protein
MYSYFVSIRYATPLLILFLVSGCASTFGEKHYFQTVNEKTGDVSNYYRLTVKGFTAFSSARYVSGYYDVRAVDMFFNELKIGETAQGTTSSAKLFVDNLKEPGTSNIITPLSPSKGNGAFVMVLSTNASSVTNTIGQFAENQIVADAITNLANRDLLIAEEIKGQADVLSANATKDELIELFKLVPSTQRPEAEETSNAYLRILNSIARGLGYDQSGFKTFKEAKDWMQNEKGGI